MDTPDNKSTYFIRVFKEERTLELWVKNKSSDIFEIIRSFSLADSSLSLGPRKQNKDLKIPEGYYTLTIDDSSLHIGFPNIADNIMQRNSKLKENVYITGKNALPGNIRLNEPDFNELYVFLRKDENPGALIPIHLFPFKLSSENIKQKESQTASADIQFWQHIQPGFLHFELTRQLPVYTYSRKGYWFLKD